MADFPTIIDLSPVPQRNQNIDDFSARADAVLGKLPLWGEQLGQWAGVANVLAAAIKSDRELSQSARDAAIAARDAAQLAGNIYPDTATGLASGDQYFSVISSESNQLFTLYENDGGSAVALRVYQGGPLSDQVVDSATGDDQALSGALNDRFSGVSVLNFDFNYVSFDITQPLRSAINMASSVGGGVVIIPDWLNFKINNSDIVNGSIIDIPSNVYIKAQGRAKITLSDSANDNGGSLYSLFRCVGSNCGVEGIDIDCNYQNQPSTAQIISLSGSSAASDVSWKKIRLINSFDAAQTNTGSTLNGPFEIEDVSLVNNMGRGVRVRYTKGVVAKLSDATFDLLPGKESSSYFEVTYSHDVTCLAGNVEHAGTDRGVGFRIVNGSSNVKIVGGHVEKGLISIFSTDSRDVTFVGTTGNGPNRGIRTGQSNPGHPGADNVTFTDVKIENIIDAGMDASITEDGAGGSMKNVMLLNSTLHCLASAQFGISAGGAQFGEIDVKEFNNEIIMDGSAPKRLGTFSPIDRVKSRGFFTGMAQIPPDTSHFFEVEDTAVTSGNVEIVANATGIAGAYHFRIRSGGSTAMFDGWKTPAGVSTFEKTTGPLTGTTGSASRVTVSADTNGIWIENRTGSSPMFTVTFSSLSGNFVQ